MTPIDLLPFLNAGGLVAVLIYQLWRMETGAIVPRDVMDEIITAVVKRVLEELEARE